jgi:predicted  nucleic acid-binding Zn-ribbon protein
MQITSETLNVIFVISQIILTIGGAIFAIKRSLTDPLRKENEELKEFIISQLKEFKKLHEEEIQSVRKRLDLLEHKVEERVTKEEHYRDLGGFRTEFHWLRDKMDQILIALASVAKDTALAMYLKGENNERKSS